MLYDTRWTLTLTWTSYERCGGNSALDEWTRGHCIMSHGPVLRSSQHTDTGPADSGISLVKRARRSSCTGGANETVWWTGDYGVGMSARENVRCTDIGDAAPTTNGNVTARGRSLRRRAREHTTTYRRRKPRGDNDEKKKTQFIGRNGTGSGSTTVY